MSHGGKGMVSPRGPRSACSAANLAARAPARSGRRLSTVTGHSWVLMVNSTASVRGSRTRVWRSLRSQTSSMPEASGRTTSGDSWGSGRNRSSWLWIDRFRRRTGRSTRSRSKKVSTLACQLLGVVGDRGVDGGQGAPQLVVQPPVRREAQRGGLEPVAARRRREHEAQVLLRRAVRPRSRGCEARVTGCGGPVGVVDRQPGGDQLEHLGAAASRAAGRAAKTSSGRSASSRSLSASSCVDAVVDDQPAVQVEGADAHRQPRRTGLELELVEPGRGRWGRGVHRPSMGPAAGTAGCDGRLRPHPGPLWNSRAAARYALALVCAGRLGPFAPRSDRTSN